MSETTNELAAPTCSADWIPHDWKSGKMPVDSECVVDTLHIDGVVRENALARWLCWGRWTDKLVIIAWKLHHSMNDQVGRRGIPRPVECLVGQSESGGGNA
jgi:hypothetical protein